MSSEKIHSDVRPVRPTSESPGDVDARVTYVQQLVEGKMKSRLVVCGSFGLHLLYGILEDFFVAHVSLDQVFEAGNHSLGLLVKLNRR